MQGRKEFIDARNQLLDLREDYATARHDFRWPDLTIFNWALDYFDSLARDDSPTALRVVDDAGLDISLSFAELSERSNRVANLFRELGIGAGDRVLVMLGNVVPLWETMLALMKLRAVIVPTTTLIRGADLDDRLVRGAVLAVVTDAALTGHFTGAHAPEVKICVGGTQSGWTSFDSSERYSASFQARGLTHADDTLLLYFTSGTTARPKMVAHTHRSYPVGHLSTLYWLGLRPGDVHLNLSSPGWAKHAWSCFFTPWNAEATVLAYQYERFSARALLDQLVRCRVTTFCAPATVWRMLIQENLDDWPICLRECMSAGEPLNAEVIAQVQGAWGLTIRDGFGQTETTALIGNPPGQPLKAGSMGRPLPGYRVALVGAGGREGDEGEICLDLAERPLGLMAGYAGDSEKTSDVMHGGYYHTGDIATRDADGYITYVGRSDDLFKSSDYRISPFELESLLIEHEAVVEAAIVPSPDPLRLAIPKAFIALAAGYPANAATASSILAFVRDRVSPFKRIRRIEFVDLPKTISGKIRRIELRDAEQGRANAGERRTGEYWEEDL